jgi:hypothetical protein
MAKSPLSILSDDHINAIGRLVVAVSKIDVLLTDLTAALVGADILSTIALIHHQQIASKVDSLKAVVRMMRKDEASRTIQLLDDAGKIAAYRNTLVHAYWRIDENGDTYTVRFQARGEIKRSRRLTPASQILLKAEQAFELAEKLGKLRDHLLKLGNRTPRSP